MNTIKTKEFLSKYTSFVTFVMLIFILSILTQGRALSWDSIKTLIIAEAVRAFASLGVGMIIGIFTMGLINYGMSFMAIDSYYQYLVKGAIIIIAVFFDMKKYAKRA